jgi:hypothetical protein
VEQNLTWPRNLQFFLVLAVEFQISNRWSFLDSWLFSIIRDDQGSNHLIHDRDQCFEFDEWTP